jgi:hypothetical protein
LSEEHKLQLSENKVLRKRCGLKKEVNYYITRELSDLYGTGPGSCQMVGYGNSRVEL